MHTPNSTQHDHEAQLFNSQEPVYFDDRKDDIENNDEELDDTEVDERGDWGDVDPAGGDAPSSPGSAV